MTYPDQTTESITYDGNDHRQTEVDRLGRTTTFTYDALGRLVKTTYPDNSFTQVVYDAVGRAVQAIDALNHSTFSTYNDVGQLTSVTDALNNITSFSYDSAGNRTSMTDALNHTTRFVYDNDNRRIRTIYPDQTSSSVTLDELGRQTNKTDQAGKITQYGYDALGRLTSVTEFVNGSPLVTRYTYDELGRRISQTDANGHITRFAYDQLGRRTGRTLPLGMSETYGYDAVGNMTSRTDFNGHTTAYQYDSMNRLTVKTADAFFSTGACTGGLCGATQITYGYDEAGRRTSMADASGITSYTYDAHDRLLTKSARTGTLVYTYDASGNMLSLSSSNAGGASMTYTYDALSRLASVTDASGMTSYNYNAVGNLGGFTYPNGVQTSYTYDTLNRLTQTKSVCASGVGCGAPGAAIASYTYTLGPAGNRLSVAELGGRTVSYVYDDLYRLTSETISGAALQNGAISYQYDSVGNRLQRNSTVPAIPPTGLLNYDANDRTATDPYDNDGNLLNAGVGSNVYDFENRLVQAGNVRLVYDGDGNRVAETVAGVTTRFLVADQNLTGYPQVMDELQGDTVTRAYSYGLELIDERQTINGTPITSFYGYDGHGSVRFLTDSNGATTDTYDYDAFGNLISNTGSTPNNYLFAGEQFDPALGVYYNRARYYDQRADRFWSMDTWDGDSHDPQSLHKYLYASANAVDRVDRSGHDWDLPSLGAVTATIGTLATQCWAALQNVAYTIYFNLYRVPIIIDQVAQWLTIAAGTLEAILFATNAVEDMARNLQNNTMTFSAGPTTMGDQMEEAAGVNLQHNTQSYDAYYPESETVIQLKGTRATSSPQALMRVVKTAIGNLDSAPERVDTYYRTGQPVSIIRANLKVRVAMIAIPDEPVPWNFAAFMAEVEQLEQAEQVLVKIVPTPGLR